MGGAVRIPISQAEKGAVSGVATLDGSGKHPLSETPSALLSALQFQGTWNASTNAPTLLSPVQATKGHVWIVAVGGATDLDGETDWVAGDWVVGDSDLKWAKIDNTELVVSVAGKTGAVTLVEADITDLDHVDSVHRALTTNPHSVTKTQAGLANVENTKVNLTATVDPTVDDDIDAGYVPGSLWVNLTGNEAFVCIDNSADAAIWFSLTSRLRLIGSGVTACADTSQITLWTGTVTPNKGILAVIGCEDDLNLWIVNDSLTTVFSGWAHYIFRKTATVDEYNLYLRQSSGASRDISWAVYEQG